MYHVNCFAYFHCFVLQFLSRAYYVLGTVLNTGDTALKRLENKDKNSCLYRRVLIGRTHEARKGDESIRNGENFKF